jgi:hypothetical protein
LVIATEDTLSQPVREAASAFWAAVWQAAGDAGQIQAATNDLLATPTITAADADRIASRYRPLNIDARPPGLLTHAEVSVQVHVLPFPASAQLDTQEQSWSRAPRVEVLPDRLMLLGYDGDELDLEVIGNPIPSPLAAGPDPQLAEAEQMKIVDGNLELNADIKWMVDFQEAVEKGMGFRVALTATQARRGFDKLMVVGLRVSADEQEGKELIETLFRHHHQGSAGFSLLPQGTPTNNTSKQGAGFSETEDSDQSYDEVFLPPSETPDPDDPAWLDKTDGEWLGEWLGIDPTIFDTVSHAAGKDQAEARAMNMALWPATLGYFMESMMQPAFDEDTIVFTRWFFNHFVSGRGPIPAIRVSDQPYGILPTTAFSKMRWQNNRTSPIPQNLTPPRTPFLFLPKMYPILSQMQADWQQMLAKVSHVGKPGDPHQTLLDVVGLNAHSVEFHQRWAESQNDIFNRLKTGDAEKPFLESSLAQYFTGPAREVLTRMGFKATAWPELLEKFFIKKANLLKGHLIDDQDLSEVHAIRAYTPENENYISWLIRSAETSYDTLRRQDGFIDDKAPSALLYLTLRHALELSYYEATLLLLQVSEQISREELTAARIEPDFIHVTEQAPTQVAPPSDATRQYTAKPLAYARASESRYHYLYQRRPEITNSDTDRLADVVTKQIKTHFAARYLKDQVQALKHLADIPTARLERLFTEHIDLCSYRLDAWMQSMTTFQLAAMRYPEADIPGEGSNPRTGVYVGAYGYLESVRPENKSLQPVANLPADLDAIFNTPTEPPLMRDSTNYGYIHAPSLNHAVTAAILRNGYLANANPDNPDTLAINLSSERVQKAMFVLEGMRSGQRLAALLGYQVERGLHDKHAIAEMDEYIYDLRRAFPLRGNRIGKTRTARSTAITAVEARNVIDGVKLVNAANQAGPPSFGYPFDLEALPAAGSAAGRAIIAEIVAAMDVNDAVSDLALAESVFQTVQGNADRAAGTLDTYSQGGIPQDPMVVQTPRSGVHLTHRMGLHFPAGLPSNPGTSPRAQAEPAINAWLTTLLPPLGDIICQVSFFQHTTQTQRSETVSMDQLGLQALDLLYLINPDEEASMTDLDDRVAYYIQQNVPLRPDATLDIQYFHQVPGTVSIFEVAALMRPLRAMILRARPLKLGDVMLPAEATQPKQAEVFLDRQRLVHVRDFLQTQLTTPLANFLSDMESPLANLEADPTLTAPVIAGIDGWIHALNAVLVEVGRCGLPQTGTGFTYQWMRGQMKAMLAIAQVLSDRWGAALAAYDALIAAHDALPAATPEPDKNTYLTRAENLISTSLTTPIPANAAYRTQLDAKRGVFQSRLNEVLQFQEQAHTGIAAAWDALNALLPISDVDREPVDVQPVAAAILAFAGEIQQRGLLLRDDLQARITSANTMLQAHTDTAIAEDKVQALLKAATFLLQPGFKLVPEFTLPEPQASEWANGFQDRSHVLRHQETTLGRPFPVDEWLYGVARVREAAHDWEQAVQMLEALRPGLSLDLTPVQLPYLPDDHWLGLAFPDTYVFEQDRLLYTAHYPNGIFDKTQHQCGLLLDDWTEVIPSREETTGITFHYDRPNSEPPQSLLLVTPPQFEGEWQWQDLVDAIHETMNMARLRAVEPEQIRQSAYGTFLPATLSAVTFHPITIAMNLALNNQLLDLINPDA